MRFIRPFFFAIATLATLVFSAPVACAQVYKTFYSDTSDNSGSFAFGKLVQGSDGNFYGTTAFGRLKNIGTVFKMTPDGNVVTLLF
ncbi:MAG: hypothetical protein JWL59_438 [Chthoniobacteraceae bacterium]|nr:hypothetical protein [Chthoniobacteraceae bacterium]